ncbi:hypothetical protein TNCV_3487931 [Trichonephila clavipes]|nr:hypothetical protein TNCV_3487931 [Trichonephila clavipes]
MLAKIPIVNKSSTSTPAHLLPSIASVAVTTSSEFLPSIPLLITASSASNSLCTSVESSSSNQVLFPSTSSMFIALSTEIHPCVLETIISTSSSIPSTITSSSSQASKQTSKTRRKKRPNRNINQQQSPIKPKVGIQMTPHKPRKSTSLQDEDMLVYDVNEEGVEVDIRRWLMYPTTFGTVILQNSINGYL